MKHNFKKKFGQNFIKDRQIIDKIIRKAEIDTDTLVIEIGPGAGALTEELIKVAGHVMAYEVDLELKDALTEKFSNTKNLSIIWEDFLKRDISKDIQKFNFKKIYVVANIPYYITTPILEHIIDSKVDIEKIVIMIQKEVGERFSASPNSKDYGSITVFLNYYYNIKKLFLVNRESFYPKPNVDSVVISLTRKEKIYLKNESHFFKLVRDSFQYKRKILRNNLKSYDLKNIEKTLNRLGYDLSIRAEALPIDVFVEISNDLNNE